MRKIRDESGRGEKERLTEWRQLTSTVNERKGDGDGRGKKRGMRKEGTMEEETE